MNHDGVYIEKELSQLSWEFGEFVALDLVCEREKSGFKSRDFTIEKHEKKFNKHNIFSGVIRFIERNALSI
jgi:hypothetical protein